MSRAVCCTRGSIFAAALLLSACGARRYEAGQGVDPQSRASVLIDCRMKVSAARRSAVGGAMLAGAGVLGGAVGGMIAAVAAEQSAAEPYEVAVDRCMSARGFHIKTAS